MASEERRETLLNKREEKHYYENCPGCKMDLHKAGQTGLPVKELFTIWVVVLGTALPISSLFPFLYFMVRDFHIAKREEDIGSYAGYIGSAFMFGRTLTSAFWGVVADQYGRKPVIIFGTSIVIIFNTFFGLSANFWMAVVTRFLLGSLNGLLGPIKAYAAEIFREEYQALGMSTISSAWGIGLIIGPALGGFLAQPAEKYPDLFSKGSLFGRFPYFLPCLCISVFALVVAVGSFWIPLLLMKRGGQVIYGGKLGEKSQTMVDYFQSIPGIPPIPSGYNPATWMLEISTPAAEERMGEDFAVIYRNSEQFRGVEALIKQLSVPPENSEPLKFTSIYSQGTPLKICSLLWVHFILHACSWGSIMLLPYNQ